MIHLLDTNVLSALRRPDRSPKLLIWLADRPETDLFLSVITLGEIERGITQQRRRSPAFADDLRAWLDRTVTLFADRILPFDAAAARHWGRLSANLGHDGADLLIAATAQAFGAPLATLTGAHVGEDLVILVCGTEVMRPVLQEALTSGTFMLSTSDGPDAQRVAKHLDTRDCRN